MNGRQWRPGGSSGGHANTGPGHGTAPGKHTLVEGLDVGPPIQTKLTVSSPGDSHEQEADRVADQVMSGSPVNAPITPITPLVQQQANEHAEPTVVAAVASGAGPDSARDSAPDAPGAMLAGAAGSVPDPADGASADGPGPAQSSPASQLGPHDEITLMAKELAGHAPQDHGGLADQVASTQGGGAALPGAERTFFESRFGQSFSDVRIHTGGDAVEMNAQLGARAFTHQQGVYFGAGQYRPGDDDGRRLLAHELTHVVQQTHGNAQGSVQRQEKDKGKPKPDGFLVRVPATEVGKPQEFLVITLAQAFAVSQARAREIITKEGWHWEGGWSGPSASDVKAGYVDVVFETQRFRETKDKLKPAGERDASGRLQGAAGRETALQGLPGGEQLGVNQEANRQFWARAKYKVGQPLGGSPEDRRQAKLWLEIRDEILANREKIKALPPDIKAVLGGDGAIAPKDYDKALQVAGKLAKLDPKDRAMYELHGLTDGLDELDRKLDQSAAKPGEPTASPAELQHLLKLFKDRVKDPQFSDGKGQSWLKFAKFLDQNKDKMRRHSAGQSAGTPHPGQDRAGHRRVREIHLCRTRGQRGARQARDAGRFRQEVQVRPRMAEAVQGRPQAAHRLRQAQPR